jgi:cytochrome c-type biogenesis protein CcmH/NrfG
MQVHQRTLLYTTPPFPALVKVFHHCLPAACTLLHASHTCSTNSYLKWMQVPQLQPHRCLLQQHQPAHQQVMQELTLPLQQQLLPPQVALLTLLLQQQRRRAQLLRCC